MSAGKEDTPEHELVIIRRRGGGEEGGHKGGVWKIAYADFMTAMMAFFLVMWLINAADKKTITQIATYFNPLRLNDKVPSTRGFYDSDQAAGRRRSRTPPASEQDEEQDEKQSEATPSDPSGLAPRVMGDRRREQQPRTLGEDAAAGSINGDAFRDPFDPAFVRTSPGAGGRERTEAAPLAPPRPQAAAPTPKDVAPQQKMADAKEIANGKDAAVSSPPATQPVEQAPPPLAASQDAAKEKVAPDRKEQPLRSADRDAAEKAVATAELAALGAAIKEAAKSSGPGGGPDVEVKATDEGTLISLTDKFDFGMFALSSAAPRPELVAIMERIAKVLNERPGGIVVRGHTDGRVYRSGNYDNWRLSAARAYMAYSLLVRGGVEEKRFMRIEGYADRSLKVIDDPNAAQNRRIEILLRRTDS